MNTTDYAQANIEEPETVEPPKYNTLFGKIKQAKNDSSNPADFAKSASQIICGSILFTISLALATLLPVASLVIGILYLEKCSIQKYIPIWLIVMGAVGIYTALTKAITNTIQKCRKSKETSSCCLFDCLNCIASVFLLGWFIAGNVWVYGNYKTVSYNATGDLNLYCDKVCYLYSFWFITVSWGILALALGCICIFCIVCGGVFACIGCTV